MTFEPVSEPPDAAWQRAAHWIARQAKETLWSEAGCRSRRYLEEEQDMTEATIVHPELGYVPVHRRE